MTATQEYGKRFRIVLNTENICFAICRCCFILGPPASKSGRFRWRTGKTTGLQLEPMLKNSRHTARSAISIHLLGDGSPPNMIEKDDEQESSRVTLARYKESTETAQVHAYFAHSYNELFSGIENGLTKLRDGQRFDQNSLALVETLIKACKRGSELAAQMLASSRIPEYWTNIDRKG